VLIGMETLTGGATPSCDPAPGPLVAGTVVITGIKTLTFPMLKDGLAAATVIVTVPLWAVPAGVVTENVYEPTGTVPLTLRLMGRLCDVAPERIVAAKPLCVKVTAVAVAKLNPAIWTWVVRPWGTLAGATPEMIGGTSTVKGCGLVAVPLVFVTVMGPVVAPVGTVVVIVLAVADWTVAVVPLNFT
jgi:hypothetical protein